LKVITSFTWQDLVLQDDDGLQICLAYLTIEQLTLLKHETYLVDQARAGVAHVKDVSATSRTHRGYALPVA
jgi:hypothetical protein